MRIRIPQDHDSVALVELIRQFPTPTRSSPAELAGILFIKLRDSSSYIFVAEDDSGLVGYVSGCRHAAFYAGGYTAWIDEILVKEDRRRANIGSLLLAAFEERAAADGCRLVSLATAGAGPFYAKLGYGTKAGYYKKYLSGAEQTAAVDCPSTSATEQ